MCRFGPITHYLQWTPAFYTLGYCLECPPALVTALSVITLTNPAPAASPSALTDHLNLLQKGDPAAGYQPVLRRWLRVGTQLPGCSRRWQPSTFRTFCTWRFLGVSRHDLKKTVCNCDCKRLPSKEYALDISGFWMLRGPTRHNGRPIPSLVFPSSSAARLLLHVTRESI